MTPTGRTRQHTRSPRGVVQRRQDVPYHGGRRSSAIKGWKKAHQHSTAQHNNPVRHGTARESRGRTERECAAVVGARKRGGGDSPPSLFYHRRTETRPGGAWSANLRPQQGITSVGRITADHWMSTLLIR
ncbi:hypothetical protein J6590_018864 [Homalodisca vitripennis]|nr:hypothetical protein J6590_018864 [Homalodisca vitripennis]